MHERPRKRRQGEGTQFLTGLHYPVWFAAIREPGQDQVTILMDDFGGGPGVLLLQNAHELDQFARNCQHAAADGHPCESTPVEIGSRRDLSEWMRGPAKAHGAHMIYLWEQVRGR